MTSAVLHPVLSWPDSGVPREGIERVPLRRPRFTMSEVLLLNELINRSPEAVTVSRLRRVLQSYSGRYYAVTEDAVRAHVTNLRAKLGEVSRAPTLIVTCHVENRAGEVELAYLYREPEAES